MPKIKCNILWGWKRFLSCFFSAFCFSQRHKICLILLVMLLWLLFNVKEGSNEGKRYCQIFFPSTFERFSLFFRHWIFRNQQQTLIINWLKGIFYSNIHISTFQMQEGLGRLYNRMNELQLHVKCKICNERANSSKISEEKEMKIENSLKQMKCVAR